jgi:hypothetical protein
VGVRLPVQAHPHCEIHRRQCQTAQVGEVGEFLPVSTHRPNRQNTGEKRHSHARSRGQRGATRKRREEAAGPSGCQKRPGGREQGEGEAQDSITISNQNRLIIAAFEIACTQLGVIAESLELGRRNSREPLCASAPTPRGRETDQAER